MNEDSNDLKIYNCECFNKVISKLFSGNDEEIISQKCTFGDEFNYFYKNTNMFKNDNIWNIYQHIKWKYLFMEWKWSLYSTKVLGIVGFWVCLKLLGIGPCERSWVYVNSLKIGNIPHTEGDNI